MKYSIAFLLLLVLSQLSAQDLRNTRIPGYRGIWFELNQKYEFGDKYAGGLGTYTAKHRPLAVYAPEVNKTFFVFGGTTQKDERHLLAMIGAFDHRTGLLTQPVVAYDKQTVDDPHDNPSLLIDPAGYLWVFVSGRGSKRPGIQLRSREPYDISAFELIREAEFTYPQIWQTDSGMVHFFTKYSGVRELYFETSPDGQTWSPTQKLAGIREAEDEKGGHYQLSEVRPDGSLIGTFFNRHQNGHPDTRTDLYYLQSRDQGKRWETVEGKQLRTPVEMVASPSRVIDYQRQGKNVYMKDMAYDSAGNPICLYLTSNGHEPGPGNAPYTWQLTFFRDGAWHTHAICESDHNYDMGSLYLREKSWQVVIPSEDPPQPHGVGGEVAIWQSMDQGKNWEKERQLTQNSALNHSYVRRPLNFQAPFCFFWATGDPHQLSRSDLHFGDFEGRVWRMPYEMKGLRARPEQIAGPATN
ncbi:MAG: BNR-4 repeat-containing protein [Bacteroidota bacterium]